VSDPFVAEIRMFAGNFAPRGWAFCNGQLLPLSQNTALFSLLGTSYGGDGKVNFALPDLQGRVPLHAGDGPGLTSRSLGEAGGEETIALTEAQMPAHGHSLKLTPQASSGKASERDPSGNMLARPKEHIYAGGAAGVVSMDAVGRVLPAGGSQPHSNLQPYLVVNFIIALQGVYPPRS